MVVFQQIHPVDSLHLATPSSTSSSSHPSSSSSSSRLAAILFDIDGTLVNSDPIHFAVFRELLLQQEGFNQNQPIDEAFFRKWISGRANPLITADFFPDWSVEQRQEWSEMKEATFRQQAQQGMMESKMPGLDRLRTWIDTQHHQQPQSQPALRKAAVTNAPRANAEAILHGIDYYHWFGSDYIIIGDECERPKPDPCPYLTACRRLHVAPQDCIVFEDSPSGVQAGVAAGAYVIGILASGQSPVTLQQAGCHMTIQDFDDPLLWNYLEQRMQQSQPPMQSQEEQPSQQSSQPTKTITTLSEESTSPSSSSLPSPQ